MYKESATDEVTAEVVDLKKLLRKLIRRSRRSKFFVPLLFLPMHLGYIVIIVVLAVVFREGVIPSGTFNTVIFWYAVFQFSSPLLLGTGWSIAVFVKYCRKLRNAFEELPHNIVWIYKATRSGVFQNTYYVYVNPLIGGFFDLKCSEEEADAIIDSFRSLFPDVSRGWDEEAASRFECDPTDLRRAPVYTEKVRTV